MESDDAIILKAAPYSETTLLLSLLTREHGVVRALAKGARRAKQNVQAAFEPFAWIQASLRVPSSDGLYSLFSPELRAGWPYLRTDMDRLAYASLGLEVLGALATHSPPEPFFFEQGVTFLENLSVCAGAGSLTIALLLRLLHQAGFAPRLADAWTPQTLPPTLSYHFDQGILAPAHAADSSRAMRLPRPAVAAILPALLAPPSLDGSLSVPTPAGRPILRWLIRVWQDHLNQPLHAAEFLEKMILREP